MKGVYSQQGAQVFKVALRACFFVEGVFVPSLDELFGRHGLWRCDARDLALKTQAAKPGSYFSIILKN